MNSLVLAGLKMKKILKIVTIIAVAGILMFVGWMFRQERLFSSPDKIRPWAQKEWEEIRQPATPLPDTRKPIRPTVSYDFSDETKIAATWSNPREATPPQLQIFEADENGVAVLPNGNKLTLAATAAIFTEDLVKDGEPFPRYGEIEYPWQDYATKEAVYGHHNWALLNFSRLGIGYNLGLGLKSDREARFVWTERAAYDARTHAKVGVTSAKYHVQDHPTILLRFGIQHQTPLVVTQDFWFGEPESHDFSIEPGAMLKFSDGMTLKLAHIRRGMIDSMGYPEKEDDPCKMHLGISAGKSQVAIIEVFPPPLPDEIVIQYKSDQGRTYHAAMQGELGVYHARIAVRSDETLIKARVLRTPERGRVIFNIDSPNRLPVESQNLFNVSVPHIEFSNSFTLERQLAGLVELKASQPWGLIPVKSFPLEYRDLTIREIFEYYEKRTGIRLRVNQKQQSIEVDDHKGIGAKLSRWKEDVMGWFE